MKLKPVVAGGAIMALVLALFWLLLQSPSVPAVDSERADVAGAVAADSRPAEQMAGDIRAGNGTEMGQGTGAVARPRNAAGYLPAELRVLKNGSISMDDVSRILHEKDFDHFLADLASENATDSAASDLETAYRHEFEAMLGNAANAQLSSLECGLSLCAGAARTKGDAGAAEYRAWRDLFDSSDVLPVYAFVDGEVPRGSDDVEMRFFFSMDPDANGLTFGPGR